jgi:hypothetical protein
LIELQEKVNIRNSLIEQNYVSIAEKDKIIAQDSVQIAEFEDFKKKYDQKLLQGYI